MTRRASGWVGDRRTAPPDRHPNRAVAALDRIIWDRERRLAVFADDAVRWVGIATTDPDFRRMAGVERLPADYARRAAEVAHELWVLQAVRRALLARRGLSPAPTRP